MPTWMKPLQDLRYNPVGSHASGAATAATTLSPPAGAGQILIQAITQNIRYTLDGSTPGTASGFQLLAGDPPRRIPIGNDTTLKVIQEAATADLEYQWLE